MLQILTIQLAIVTIFTIQNVFVWTNIGVYIITHLFVSPNPLQNHLIIQHSLQQSSNNSNAETYPLYYYTWQHKYNNGANSDQYTQNIHVHLAVSPALYWSLVMQSYFHTFSPHLKDKSYLSVGGLETIDTFITKPTVVASLGDQNVLYLRKGTNNHNNGQSRRPNNLQRQIQLEMSQDVMEQDRSARAMVNLKFEDSTGQTDQHGQFISLPGSTNYTLQSLSPNANKCLLSTDGSQVCELDLYTHELRTILNSSALVPPFSSAATTAPTQIIGLKYAPCGKQAIIIPKANKCLLINLETNTTVKCRPGHLGQTIDAFFSHDSKHLVTIGTDSFLLVYDTAKGKQPQQIAKMKIFNTYDNLPKFGSFSHSKAGTIYAPGEHTVQVITFIDRTSQISRLSQIKHTQPINIVVALPTEHLVTCCSQMVYVWNLITNQKLYVMEDMTFCQILPFDESFCASRNDGKVHVFKHKLHAPVKRLQQSVAMESTDERIQFTVDNNDGHDTDKKSQAQGSEASGDQDSEGSNEGHNRPSLADAIIKVLPQQPLTYATSMFGNCRFLFMNSHGCVYEKRENDQTMVGVELATQTTQGRTIKCWLYGVKGFTHFDIAQQRLAYANETQLRVRQLKGDKQELVIRCRGIQYVCLGSGWVACSCDNGIRVFDSYGFQLKHICFDRQIVAIAGYQNLLAVVYHESVPIWGQQCLGLQLFTVDRAYGMLRLQEGTVPVTTQQQLKVFKFTHEGMLISQDKSGKIRAYSFESGEWTPIYILGVENPNQAWLLGMNNYQATYYKTSQFQREPIVQPRTELLTTQVGICQLNAQTQIQLHTWRRYCADHQRFRCRVWGRLKSCRLDTSPYYSLSASIADESKIVEMHHSLDREILAIAKQLIVNKEFVKAACLVKSCVRSSKTGIKACQYLDNFKQRELALDLELYYDEYDKAIEYESSQLLDLTAVKNQIESKFNTKVTDPMIRGHHRTIDTNPLLHTPPVNIVIQYSQPTSNNNDTSAVDLSHEKVNISHLLSTSDAHHNVSTNSVKGLTAKDSTQTNNKTTQWKNPFIKPPNAVSALEIKTKEIQELSKMARRGLEAKK